jgi:cell division protein FtsI (penicillin-binding protein 3)
MKRVRQQQPAAPNLLQRRIFLLAGLLSLAALSLAVVAVRLQVVDHAQLTSRGDARSMRVVSTVAHRGKITDRYDNSLAVSAPVETLWTNPGDLRGRDGQVQRLARTLGVNGSELVRRVRDNSGREFLYLARGLDPAEAARVRALNIEGLNLLTEYRRYYPASDVTSHLLGFTNIDDIGAEGVEMSFDHELAGEAGLKRVIQDRRGRKVEDVESIRAVEPGKDLALSLDLRIQYLAYRELKSALLENRARAGSVVLLDIQSGEVLAMVSLPAFNPNVRDKGDADTRRNRAVTDQFEPGSSIKPFIVAAALSSGRYTADSVIDTGDGVLQVGNKRFTDEHKIGAAPLALAIAKSSNVAMAIIALSLEPRHIWQTLNGLGFGSSSNVSLPAEANGSLANYSHWRSINIATMSHGYGLSVTSLQLVRAYATIGAYGIRRPVSVQRLDGPVIGERVLDEATCRSLIGLLENVTSSEGTGTRARIPGYRVAGKTGTAWKAVAGGYSHDRYVATFAGVVPASNPRLAAVVMIDEPSAGKYYGGEVAAPVFSAVLGGALRLMAIAPDDIGNEVEQAAAHHQLQVARR